MDLPHLCSVTDSFGYSGTGELCIKILKVNRMIKVIELDREKESKQVLEQLDELILRNNKESSGSPKASDVGLGGPKPSASALETEVGKLLKAEGLERVARVLYNEEVYTKEVAKTLTDDDYVSLGIKLGTRRRLMKLFNPVRTVSELGVRRRRKDRYKFDLE